MPEYDWDYLDLPADPMELTRELALQIFERPELFAQQYARLAAASPCPAPASEPLGKPNRSGALTSAKAALNGR